MKAIIFFFLVLAAILGGLWGYSRITHTEISLRALGNFGDSILSAYLVEHPEGNKASQLLAERAGDCAFNPNAIFLPDGNKIAGTFPFSYPLFLQLNAGPEWTLRCKDSLGRELALQAEASGKIMVDRSISGPLRLSVYRRARVRLQGPSLHLELSSPRGNLLLDAAGKSTVIVWATGSRKPLVTADLAITVEEGSVSITNEDSFGSDDGHSLDLLTGGGEIKWGPAGEKIGPKSNARVLPSGLYRR